MKKILIYGGTTEGRILAESLAKAGIFCDVCVATEYGEEVLPISELLEVRKGRLDISQMRDLCEENHYDAVIDATHPYATVVSQNIVQSLEIEGKDKLLLPLFRFERTEQTQLNKEQIQTGKKIHYFTDAIACAETLAKTTGNIFLTTGSKDLTIFCKEDSVKQRLTVRVLPAMESMELCHKAGLSGKQIIAMQGPFSKEMNIAQLRDYKADIMVTKETGKIGGMDTKLEAANELGLQCFVIGKPGLMQKEYLNYYKVTKLEELWEKLSEILEIKRRSGGKDFIEVLLAGIGMGNPKNQTVEVMEAIEKADYLFGAKRMLEMVEGKSAKACFPYYLAKDIIPVLETLQESEDKPIKVVILFSGDTGFYSGAKKLCDALLEKGFTNTKILPGISSLQMLAARLKVSWQDAKLISMHGVEEDIWKQAIKQVAGRKPVFFLTSGLKDLKTLGAWFMEQGLEETPFGLGYQLSYPEEEVFYATPKQCLMLEKEGLYVGMIAPYATEILEPESSLFAGIPDSEFIRGKVPMTKEEVRTLSLSKLHLKKDSVLYDIGSGTGSVSVAAAKLSQSLKVFAIESKDEAVALTKDNLARFGVRNVSVIQTLAPDGLEDLPVATHAFIGGSRGNLAQIFKCLYEKNPTMTVVGNVVSIESLCEFKTLLEKYPVEQVEYTQVSISKDKKVAGYHMMEAANPVTIISFSFTK